MQSDNLRTEVPVLPVEQDRPIRRRLIRRGELLKVLPISDTEMDARIKRGEFPRPFKLGPKVTVFDVDEVNSWIEGLAATREEGAKA